MRRYPPEPSFSFRRAPRGALPGKNGISAFVQPNAKGVEPTAVRWFVDEFGHLAPGPNSPFDVVGPIRLFLEQKLLGIAKEIAAQAAASAREYGRARTPADRPAPAEAGDMGA
jgi:hypothetical protein